MCLEGGHPPTVSSRPTASLFPAREPTITTPPPSSTMSLPGSHRKLQYQLNTPHPPGLRLSKGLAWPRRVGTRPPNPLPGPGLRGTVDAPLNPVPPRFSPRLLCTLSLAGSSRFSKPVQRLSQITPPPPSSRAHLHTVIRFLRSTATLREDAFLEDSPRAMVVWTKLASIQMCSHCCRCQLPLTPPGAPAPPPDYGWALCPSGPLDPSTAIPLPPLPVPSTLAPSPGAIPEQNKAGEGALRGAEPGPSPPPLASRPHLVQ